VAGRGLHDPPPSRLRVEWGVEIVDDFLIAGPEPNLPLQDFQNVSHLHDHAMVGNRSIF